MKVYKNKKSEKSILETYDKLMEMWDIPYQERNIATRYGMTHVIITGKEDGRPLVLFHGVGDDSALMWIYNAKELGKHFHLFAVDTIGGPGKSIPNENYNKQFDDIIWIDETLDGLGLESVDIAGVSHGGYLAQYYCMSRPGRVRKVISMADCVPCREIGNPLWTMIKIFLPEALFPTKNNVIKLIKKLSGDNYDAFLKNPILMEHYTYLLKGSNNMAMSNHKVISFDDKQIDGIRDKVLFLIGECDPFALMGGKKLLLKYNMNARFFSGAGHGVNHEISSTINDIIIEVLCD